MDFDFIVVGAGSSGCVLASELTLDPACRVLLLESGPPDTSPLIHMPRGIGKLLTPGNPHVWSYKASKGPGRGTEDWLKGRTLGGSSSVNGMVYMRGLPSEYDDWAAAGCEGWGWTDIGRCYKAMEDHELGEAEWRGVGGPVKVSIHPNDNPLYEAILNAGVQAGVPRVEDVNAALQGGLGYQPRTISDGKRWSAAKAFLDPARSRKNLVVRTGVHVQRVMFEGTRAVGVELCDAKGGGLSIVRAAREVILSAGALQTPMLLQTSGVGPADLLQRLGIPVVAHAAGVGRHLLEHRCMMMQVRLHEGSLNREYQGWRLGKNLLRYFTSQSGPMTCAAHEVCGLIKTRPDLPRPDAELGIGLYSINVKDGKVVLEDQPGMTWVGYFTTPDSEGSVQISSRDGRAAPVIDANYLHTERDKRHSVDLVRAMRRILTQPALAPYVVAETQPGPAFVSDDELVEAYSQFGSTAFHVSGTCRMGADASSVVDPQLRVRGVQALRVVDTSIMPTLISGNTNGAAMAMGLRAAEMIRGSRAAERQGAGEKQIACALI
ncbi:MAG: oxidoreductase [Burkholderiales bacterium RIFCSPHIGHO2_12_FULL_69_20]|nr:MAG: oxidoreductase [Burkholderiales bacterium RIFCSPHIGHO2_12_FULL_69_20]